MISGCVRGIVFGASGNTFFVFLGRVSRTTTGSFLGTILVSLLKYFRVMLETVFILLVVLLRSVSVLGAAVRVLLVIRFVGSGGEG